ncbi:GPI transamidase component Gab1p [Trichomonascus vanleenenianus]|uniref:GPI-anchor transamidase subunit GAB1 n=1 Tax=Trichomonascus vanleenenianus TaxID=2268995 RepID=UPI003ECAEB71
MNGKTAGVIFAGLALRIFLFSRYPGLSAFLDRQVELSTPVSSYKRLLEGLYQDSHGVSPYIGGISHQAPLLLGLFRTIADFAPSGGFEAASNLSFAVVDAVVAIALAKIAATKRDTSYSPEIVAGIYLFNPFTLLSALAKTTNLFSNATIALSMASAVAGKPIQAVSILGLASSLSLYPAYAAPALILLAIEHSPRETGPQVHNCARLGVVFLLSIVASLLANYAIAGYSWSFVDSTYGTILLFKELVPNIGLWWYFFAEMFEYFNPFFLGVFQIYLAAYGLPVAVRLHKFPVFALASVVGINTLFKAYPEAGDIGFYFSLLTLYKPVFRLIKYPIPIFLALLYASVLAPTFYHLWIYLGSGNSNFFYAITLVYALGMTMALADTIWAAVRIDYDGGKNEKVSQI